MKPDKKGLVKCPTCKGKGTIYGYVLSIKKGEEGKQLIDIPCTSCNGVKKVDWVTFINAERNPKIEFIF